MKKQPLSGWCLAGASGGAGDGRLKGGNGVAGAFGGEVCFYKYLITNIIIF